jgi:two-component system, cell cycle response regulator DivK
MAEHVPACEPFPVNVVQVSDQRAGHPPAPLRVLLVDDHLDEREMYAHWFQQQGFCTLQAATAADGFRLAAELTADVVVTDVRLGCDEDGLSLTRRLKTSAETAAIPIVVLTGYVRPDDVAAATKAGCDRFVPKPCGPDRLEQVVNRLLQRWQGRLLRRCSRR